MFQSTFIATLTTAGTTLLSLSFVFAVTTQEFLGSCIFLFVKHPYDVGDRVDIVGPEKEQLIVERISLLYTVFTRIDKNQIVQVPNITLNNLWIENVTRSKAMSEVVDVNVSFDTTFEDIELLRQEMEKFVRAPENNRDFQPDIAIRVGGVGDLDKLTLKVGIRHKSNWHNDGVRATRRSKFMCGLALAIKRVPIHAPGGGGEALGGPTNPSYSVAVNNDWATKARSTAADEKEEGRLINQNAAQANAPSAERRAAEELNTRDPLQEAVDDWGYDNTLNSRGASAERPDVGSGVRRDASHRDISTRESQRGRRKAGDTLPPMPLGDNMPAFQVTRTSTSTRAPSFDVERQAGAPSAPGAPPPRNPYTTFPTQQAYTAAAFQAGLQPDPASSSSVQGAPPAGGPSSSFSNRP